MWVPRPRYLVPYIGGGRPRMIENAERGFLTLRHEAHKAFCRGRGSAWKQQIGSEFFLHLIGTAGPELSEPSALVPRPLGFWFWCGTGVVE